ncbi:MAG: glycosyltransferase family 4 protein [bacterium]
MRILIFSTAYFPFVGGAEVAVKEITDRLPSPPAGGFQFDMITARLDRKLPKEERVGNVNVFRIGIGVAKFDKYWLSFFGGRLAQKMHERNKYDAIWSVMASYGGFAALSFKNRNKEIPFLLTLQEGDDPEYIRKRVGMAQGRFRQIFVQADRIQCISRFLVDWAGEMGAKCPIEIVPNGVDIEKFKMQSEKFKIDELKQKLGIRDGEKVVITTSRLVKKNAVGDIIDAMQYLPENIKFLILGTGELEESLKSKVKSLKLQDRVLFLGNVSNDKVPEYLAISDVFVRPALSEGLGNSFLEAMAAGVPIIGTAVGGIPDFLKDPSTSLEQATGLFCEVKNPESIAEKVKMILENNELRQKLIVNAKKLVEEKYDWNLITEEIKNIFNQIIINNK